MTARRPKTAAVMLTFKVPANCTARMARHAVWNDNRSQPIDVHWPFSDQLGVETLHPRLSRAYVGDQAPVMIDPRALLSLCAAAGAWVEDLETGLADGTYDTDPGLAVYQKALAAGVRALK